MGFIADIHGGDTYIPLKVDGVPRYPPDYDVLEDEDYQEIPDELLPIDRTTVNLWQMEDGEGRNQEMFRYIQRLQAVYHFSPDVIRRILKTQMTIYLQIRCHHQNWTPSPEMKHLINLCFLAKRTRFFILCLLTG